MSLSRPPGAHLPSPCSWQRPQNAASPPASTFHLQATRDGPVATTITCLRRAHCNAHHGPFRRQALCDPRMGSPYAPGPSDARCCPRAPLPMLPERARTGPNPSPRFAPKGLSALLPEELGGALFEQEVPPVDVEHAVLHADLPAVLHLIDLVKLPDEQVLHLLLVIVLVMLVL